MFTVYALARHKEGHLQIHIRTVRIVLSSQSFNSFRLLTKFFFISNFIYFLNPIPVSLVSSFWYHPPAVTSSISFGVFSTSLLPPSTLSELEVSNSISYGGRSEASNSAPSREFSAAPAPGPWYHPSSLRMLGVWHHFNVSCSQHIYAPSLPGLPGSPSSPLYPAWGWRNR